jgi:phosphatidate cytidylyltransferase
MTYLHPPGSSGDSTHGGDLRRHRARHGGAAPEPYGSDPYGPESYPEDRYPEDRYPYTGRPEPDPYRTEEFQRPSYDSPPPYGREPYGGEPLVYDAPMRTSQPRHSRAERRRAEEEAAAQPKSGRAGRNLPAAIGVGVVLVAVVLGSLFFWKPAFLAVVILAVGVGIWEMARAVRPGGAHPPLAPLLVGGAVMVGLGWFGGPEALALGLLVTVLATMVWRLSDGPAGYQPDIASATLIAMYVPFLAGFAVLLAVPDDGHLRVLVTLAAVVLSDTGGYVSGVFFGRHPMAPSVSPKKSWEGFAGSMVATAAGSAFLLWYLLDIAPWWGAVFGLALSLAAVLGDLAESMIKRDLGIKDMSQLLPGHGGLMDRLDSILFAVPTAYLVLSLLAPTAG